MHATHFLWLALVSFIATSLGVHHHSEDLEVKHAHVSGSKAHHVRAHKHRHKGEHNKPKVDVMTKTKFYDPTAAKRAKHPLFNLGQRLIHNAKVLLRNTTDSDDSSGASDSFVIADHEAKLIVKGHSDYLRRMQRHAGPDICMAKARALVSNKLDATKTCRSLMCTAAYTLVYTLGLKRDLPTQGCQMVEFSEDTKPASLEHEESEMPTKSEKSEKSAAKSEESTKSAKSKTSEKTDFVFFCNAKYPKLIPSVLLQSGFAPLQDKPGFWRANSSSTPFPKRLKHHHWHVHTRG